MSNNRMGSRAWLFGQIPWPCSLVALTFSAPCAALCMKVSCAAYMREQQLLEEGQVTTKVGVLAGHCAAGV